MSVCFLYIIYNFEIFLTVDSSMASKMAAKMENIYLLVVFCIFFLKKSSHFYYFAFSTSLRMYHASELFIIKDVLDIYTLQKKNACYVLPATSEKQQMLVDQKAKKSTELLLCTFAVYDCRQLEDVSSVENFHLVTELLSQIFIRYVLLPPSSIIKKCCATGIWCT